jgi:hypothetical protein
VVGVRSLDCFFLKTHDHSFYSLVAKQPVPVGIPGSARSKIIAHELT